MDSLSLVLTFIFGTVIGSFLNVVSLRYNTGRGIGGRSKCMSCNRELTWVELIPILSFLFQRGTCRKCKSKISWQYPLIEFLSGALFVLLFFTFPPTTFAAAITTVIQILAACILVVVVVYDTRHKIIPDSLVYTFGVIALLNLFVGGASSYSLWHMPTLEALLAGPILALPFALIWLISRGKWMGLGDAKLVLGIGWFLGINAGINAIVLAFWIGAVTSIIWLFYTYKGFKPKTEIPFGPYLILGMYLVMIFGMEVIDIGLLRQMLNI